MKRLTLFAKICFGLGFVATIGSIVSNAILDKDITWHVIALFWMISALISELRIKQLEEDANS